VLYRHIVYLINNDSACFVLDISLQFAVSAAKSQNYCASECFLGVEMRLLLVIVVVLLSGCAMMSPDPYKQIRDTRSRHAKTEVKDVAVDLNQPSKLSLEECIKIGLANNPEISAVTKDIYVAAAQVNSARSGFFPKVNATGGYTHYSDSIRLIQADKNSEPGVFAPNIGNAEIGFTYQIFSGGRVVNDMAAAELVHQATQKKLSFSREELAYNLSALYHNIIAQKYVVKSLQFSKESLSEQVNRIRLMLDAQKAAKVDLLRTEVKLADVEQKLIQESNSLTVSLQVLTTLMGVHAGDGIDTNDTETLYPQLSTDKNEMLSRAFAKRKDYLSAKFLLESQARKVGSARSGFLPTVTVKGAYGTRWADDITDRPASSSLEKYPDSNDESVNVGAIGFSVDIPLFEGGLTVAKVREETMKLAAAQDRLKKLELQMRLDVETAISLIESAHARLKSSRKAVEQAKESLRVERMKYDLGKGLLVDTLDAQSALLQSEVNYYRAIADYNIGQAKLLFVTGEIL
jgi:outer membrane protein